jgi:hypothetical protein
MPRPHSLRPLDCTTEVEFFQREIQIGADGSLVHNGDEVFFIEIGVVASIDYFHGCVGGRAAGQTVVDELPFYAHEVVSVATGWAVSVVRQIQQRWRKRRWHRQIVEALTIARCCVGPDRKGKFVRCLPLSEDHRGYIEE